MLAPNPMARLFCGEPPPATLNDEATPVLAGLNKLITSYYEFSVLFKADIRSAQASYFLPVALRSLMESSAIALLARIDPLRVILSSKAQTSSLYNKGVLQPSAISWRNDIVGEPHQKKPAPPPAITVPASPAAASPVAGSPAAASPVVTAPAAASPAKATVQPSNTKTLWDPNLSSAKLPRSLLCEQMCETFWTPAATNLFGFPKLPATRWMTDLRAHTPDNLPQKLIGDGNQIYSELSKGIHPEFAVRRESEYDAPTLQTYIERTFQWASALALLSHCNSTFSGRLDPTEALSLFEVVESTMT